MSFPYDVIVSFLGILRLVLISYKYGIFPVVEYSDVADNQISYSEQPTTDLS
jgi:hypothetical protein